jgi:alanyl-tRNA synthetase
MNIKTVITKFLKGDELSDEEKKFLQDYKEPKHDDSKEKDLSKQLEEAQKKLDEAENEKLSELEKLQKETERLKKENDEVKAAKAAQDFDLAVNKLANKHKFTDPGYLKYLIQNKEIDLEKDGESFMENLKKDTPKYFAAEVNPGGGGSLPAGKTPIDKNKQAYDDAKKSGDVTKMLQTTPSEKM